MPPAPCWFYGLLGYFVIRHTPRTWHLAAAILVVALIVFVGFSRVYQVKGMPAQPWAVNA